jgi:hypothetical protein
MKTDKEQKPFENRPVMRGVLFALLTLVIIGSAFASWRALFEFNLLMCLVYTLAAMAGCAGAWVLHSDQQLLSGKSRKFQAKA